MGMSLPLRMGLPAAPVTLILLGPKIALLLPVWWLGVLLDRWRGLQQISIHASWAMVLTSLAGIALFHRYEMMTLAESWLASLIGPNLTYELTFSKRVFADYMLAFLVFVNFTGMRNILTSKGGFLIAVAKPVRFFANYTFTLYLLHQPLFLFWTAVVHGDPSGPWYWSAVTLLTALSVGAVGSVTENRRHGLRAWMLPWFRRWTEGRAAAYVTSLHERP